MQASKKRWLEIAAFALVCGLLLFGASALFDPLAAGHPEYVNERDTYVASALSEAPESIDVAVLGDSEAMVLLRPTRFEEKTGLSAYLIGQSGQSVSESYYVLRAFLKQQHPKTVLFEVDSMVDDSNSRREAMEVFDAAAFHLFPVLRHHGTWKYMAGIKEPDPPVHERGFALREDVVPYEGGEYMIPTEKSEHLLTLSKVYLRKIRRLCEEEGCELVLVSAPAPLHFTYEKHNALAALAEAEGLTYLDLNLAGDALDIDYGTDMLDGGDHINATGTEKVTDYLAAWMQSRN